MVNHSIIVSTQLYLRLLLGEKKHVITPNGIGLDKLTSLQNLIINVPFQLPIALPLLAPPSVFEHFVFIASVLDNTAKSVTSIKLTLILRADLHPAFISAMFTGPHWYKINLGLRKYSELRSFNLHLEIEQNRAEKSVMWTSDRIDLVKARMVPKNGT